MVIELFLNVFIVENTEETDIDTETEDEIIESDSGTEGELL